MNRPHFAMTEHLDLNRADATALRQRAEQLAIAAHARGADARHTFALTKSAYTEIDVAAAVGHPDRGEGILSVLERALDALVPSITFAAPTRKAMTAPVPPADPYWTIE